MDSIISQVSEHPIVQKGLSAAGDGAYVAKRVLKSTGKATWLLSTSFMVFVIPLMIAMDREAQFNDLEMQQNSLLGEYH